MRWFVGAAVVVACACGDTTDGSTSNQATQGGGTGANDATGGTGGSGGEGGSASGGQGGAGGQGGTGGACDFCNDTVGVCEPLKPCSASHPCTDLLPTYSVPELAEPTAIPDCGIDAPPKQWLDPVDNITRYYCESRPPGTDPISPRPLLIFTHGSGGGAHRLHSATSLRDKSSSYDLSTDVERPGFLTVSMQGRNLHWPSSDAQDGSKHDTFHRDFDTNRDVAFYDAVVDSLVDEGVVDPQRIYLMGWSNGARFTAFYGIERHQRATPGGARIAAIANYSGGDPYENTTHTQAPSCRSSTYPTSSVPFMLVSRSCDLIACDQAQADGFATPPSPGNIAGVWVDDLNNRIGANVTWLLITGIGTIANDCNPSCGEEVAVLNHVRWPTTFEPDMLEFMKNHPL